MTRQPARLATARPLVLLAAWALLSGSALVPAAARAVLPVETQGSLTIPATPEPHWVFVNDFAFFNMLDSRTLLVDADAGRVLGTVSTGLFHNQFRIPKDYGEIYSVQTYYSRGSRGERSDVVSIYDPTTLGFTGEVLIPPKRMTNTPSIGNSALTDNDQFLIVTNMTPAISATVVDIKARKLVGEVDTGGCMMVYPTGESGFMLLCGDGTLLALDLDAAGKVTARHRSEVFFDYKNDPITDKGVRVGDRWFFTSYAGVVHPIDVSGAVPNPQATWSLFSDADSQANWRVGGGQPFATHEASGTLYALMHQGGDYSHDDPGTEVWVYDLATGKRNAKIPLKQVTSTITVSQDDKPILLGASFLTASMDVYDAKTGAHLRNIAEMGTTPFLLQTPPLAKP